MEERNQYSQLNQVMVYDKLKKKLTAALFPYYHSRHFTHLLIGTSSLLCTYLPAYALSTTTAQTIQGRTPSLSTTLVTAIQNGDNFELFGLSDGTNSYYTQSDVDTHFFNGLNLDPKVNKPNDLPALNVVLDTPSTIAPNIQALDSDGDVIDSLVEKTVGGMKLVWYRAGTNTQLTTTELNQTFCQLSGGSVIPELRAEGAITLKTKYGDPLSQDYPDTTIGITQTPKRIYDHLAAFDPSMSLVCYAKPNISNGTALYAGPTTMWDTVNGFIPQSGGNPNFPTTGLDGLYFDLMILGVDATMLSWPDGISNPALSSGNVTVSAVVTSANTVKVTLNGPKASDYTNTATALPFTGPVSFTLEGKDSGNNVKVSYEFSLQKWYINRGNLKLPVNSGTNANGDINQATWCANLNGGNYTLPTVADLTNAAGATWTGALPGNMNKGSATNLYWRYIGGGLFSEWGNMTGYTGVSFMPYPYWTRETSGTKQLVVYANNGFVSTITIGGTGEAYGLCTQP